MINLIYSYLNFYFKIKFERNFNIIISKTSIVHFWKIRFNKFKNSKLKVGEGSYVSSDINFEKDNAQLIVGDNTFISGAKFSIANYIYVGDNVQIAFGTLFFDHNSHSLNSKLRRNDLQNRFKNYKEWNDVIIQEINIESDVWIGANSIILKGITIKKGSVIAAGSVLTKSTQPYCLYGGNPAKLIKKLNCD